LVLLAVVVQAAAFHIGLSRSGKKPFPYRDTEITNHLKFRFEIHIFIIIYLFAYVFIRVFGKPILCLHVTSQQLTTPETAAAAITTCTE
jgi:hypothetical protein